MSDPIPLLVLVHPGSACGSANENLGRYEARAGRDGLKMDLDLWKGGVLVIDGVLSQDLEYFPVFDAAIKGALARAAVAGFVSERRYGSDDQDEDQAVAARAFLDEVPLPAGTRVTLTGAWYYPDGKHGCVNDVMDVFEARGFSCDVSDNAMTLADDFDEGIDDEDGDDIEVVPGP